MEKKYNEIIDWQSTLINSLPSIFFIFLFWIIFSEILNYMGALYTYDNNPIIVLAIPFTIMLMMSALRYIPSPEINHYLREMEVKPKKKVTKKRKNNLDITCDYVSRKETTNNKKRSKK